MSYEELVALTGSYPPKFLLLVYDFFKCFHQSFSFNLDALRFDSCHC